MALQIEDPTAALDRWVREVGLRTVLDIDPEDNAHALRLGPHLARIDRLDTPDTAANDVSTVGFFSVAMHPTFSGAYDLALVTPHGDATYAMTMAYSLARYCAVLVLPGKDYSIMAGFYLGEPVFTAGNATGGVWVYRTGL